MNFRSVSWNSCCVIVGPPKYLSFYRVGTPIVSDQFLLPPTDELVYAANSSSHKDAAAMTPVLFPPAGVRVYQVSELTRAVKALLEDNLGTVWVEGEVSNLARPASGHVYLTLKDNEAPLKAVLYRAVAMRIRFDLRDGMSVIARGRLAVYAPRGEYQLQIEEVQPKGIGPLELAFRQLKEKLSVRGYFERGRKKPLPRIPRRVGLISSATGSAVRDVLETLSRRWPAAEVWVRPVLVQGEGAAEAIAAALDLFNRIGGPDAPPAQRLDLLILARGGGSLEDLWPFNEEIVAEAIYGSRIPVVSGVGHEDDLTIADLVADLRALTPTDAAMKVVPDGTKVLEWLGELDGRLRALLLRRLDLARGKLDDLANRRCFRAPVERICDEERRLDDWGERIQRAIRQQLDRTKQRLEASAARLESLSPLNVLARGYSLTRRMDGVVVRKPEDVAAGELLVTRVQGGQIASRVE
jgi:exodeoxyribonuclease VII large subunit